MKKATLKNLVKNMALQYLMKVKPFRNMHSQKTLHLQSQIWYHLSLTPTIRGPESEKHTFQVGDDIYKEYSALIPEPHIQYTSH